MIPYVSYSTAYIVCLETNLSFAFVSVKLSGTLGSSIFVVGGIIFSNNLKIIIAGYSGMNHRTNSGFWKKNLVQRIIIHSKKHALSDWLTEYVSFSSYTSSTWTFLICVFRFDVSWKLNFWLNKIGIIKS